MKIKCVVPKNIHTPATEDFAWVLSPPPFPSLNGKYYSSFSSYFL